jgi:hypothetical protein
MIIERLHIRPPGRVPSNRKVAAYACTIGSAVVLVFYTPYPMPPHLEGRKHILTDVQDKYHKMIDKYVWGLPPKEFTAKHAAEDVHEKK